MEQVPQMIKEATLESSNRQIENILRDTFTSRRDLICNQCSLRPAFCLGSAADWHRCRYALRIRGGKILLPSDVALASDVGQSKPLAKEIEDLIVKTLQRTRFLTSRRKWVMRPE